MMPMPAEAVTTAYSSRSWVCSIVIFLVCLAFCLGSETKRDDGDGWLFISQHGKAVELSWGIVCHCGIVSSYVSWSLGLQGSGVGVEAEMNPRLKPDADRHHSCDADHEGQEAPLADVQRKRMLHTCQS